MSALCSAVPLVKHEFSLRSKTYTAHGEGAGRMRTARMAAWSPGKDKADLRKLVASGKILVNPYAPRSLYIQVGK